MPDILEPPAPVASEKSDSDALKAAFNKAQQEQTGVDPAATNDDTPEPEGKPALVPAKTKEKEPVAAKEEPVVPAEFIEKPKAKEEPVAEEIPQNAGAKQLREALARRDTKLKELQAEREEWKRKAESALVGLSKEQEDAHKAAIERAAQLEQKLERAAYAESPKFQRFNAEEAAELGSAKSYLEGTEINPGIIEAAARTAGQARLRLLRDAGMDTETIAAIGPHLARADAIRRERDASLENWKSGLAADQEAQRAQRAQEEERRVADEQKIFKQVGEKMKTTLEAFQRVDGHDKWNAMVEQNEKDAEAFFAGQKELPELAELAYEGVAARTTKLINNELRRQLNAANEELGRLRAAQPGTGHSADAKAGDSSVPVSEQEGYKRAFRDAQAQVGSR